MDFTAPLVELIPLINMEANLGNYLLVYISSSLAGRGYPIGEIPEKLVQNVKHEVLRCLTAYHSINNTEDELPYPYMRALLNYSVRETINVLSLAFQEKEFTGDLGFSHRQRIINILLEVLSPEHSTWSQRGCLLNFVASQIASNVLADSDLFLGEVVSYFTMEEIPNETVREHSEREQAWLELLRAKHLVHIPMERLIELSRQAKCHRVTEYLLLEVERYDEILDTYLCDNRRHIEMYHYLFRYANHPERSIYDQVSQKFDQFLNVNFENTTKLVIEHFKNKIPELIRKLESGSKNLFLFLDTLLRENITLESVQYEIYLDLLSTYNPICVVEFLKTTDMYRLEQALEICLRHNIQDGCMFLYEKCGNFDEAYQMALKYLDSENSTSLEERAMEITSLCSRASIILSLQDKEHLWFAWLEVILARADLYGVMKQALHAASSHVDLANLVQLVLSHSARQSNFGDIKDILVCMLSNSKYESVSLQKAASILSTDLHGILDKELRKARRGLCIKSIKCTVCRKKLRQPDMKVIVFGSCGHALHEACFEEQKNLLDKMECPRCGKTVVKNTSSIELQTTSKQILDGVKINSSMTLETRAPPYLRNRCD